MMALSNGNYVVGGSIANGAHGDPSVTWCDGSAACVGTVSAANSLVGAGGQIVPLASGNYVICNLAWNEYRGAVTWVSGSGITSGVVSAANSLTGSSPNDFICYDGVYPLANGNYVVDSSFWNNGSATRAGAVTWGNGATGTAGVVSEANSLVGTSAGDAVGEFAGVTPLANGNYVVHSYHWSNGHAMFAGAVTWGDGNTGVAGAVSASNSLVGERAYDWVGYNVIALSNGNYLVGSYHWNDNLGAATWGNGNGGVIGPISATNSLIGNCPANQVSEGPMGLTALSNGNYVVASPTWCNGSAILAGASTWGSGDGGLVGTISTTNSLTGSDGDYIGNTSVAFSDGNYAIISIDWQGVGAVTFGAGAMGTTGAISAANSVLGRVAGCCQQFVVGYDPSRLQLVVGQPAAKLVSLFSDRVFKDGFE